LTNNLLVRLRRLGPIFLIAVVIPTLGAFLYFGLFASDVYVSESRFVVRSPSKAAVTSLGQVLSSGGLTGASEESNAVIEYLESRSAVADANRANLLSRAWSDARIFVLDRFGGLREPNRERLYRYYLDKVTVEDEPTTQVVHLTVRAFAAPDAQAINERLLERSEALVNRLSDRARGDALALANREVDEAQQRARNAAIALADYRNRSRIIDPEKQAAARLQMVSKLQDELIAAQTQLKQMETYTPQATQIPYLRTQVASLQREIAAQTASIAGGSGSLSSTAARYQVLLLDSELAGKQLAAALIGLQDARAEARRKRAYVERIAEPSLPDYAVEPKRLRGIVATLLLGLLTWGILSVLLVGVREHRD
jgi:ABC-2 type transport system permease protein/capsular polysaccharide transport system permease protein